MMCYDWMRSLEVLKQPVYILEIFAVKVKILLKNLAALLWFLFYDI